MRSFKNKTIERFVVHIGDLLKHEPWLKDASDASFRDCLAQKFNSQNWAFCFYYMRDYIDFEASSDAGKWYMENIYVNLGLEIKHFIDDDQSRNAREELLLAYDILALNESFDGINKSDFVELTERSRRSQRVKKRNFAEAIDRRLIVFLLPVPVQTRHLPPRARATTATVPLLMTVRPKIPMILIVNEIFGP